MTQIDNIEKLKLDSEFSIHYSMPFVELQRLADDYEMLKARMIQDIHDISDKLTFLYADIKSKSPRGAG